MTKKDKEIAVYFDEKWHLPIEEVKRIIAESKDLGDFETKMNTLLKHQMEDLSDLNEKLIKALHFRPHKK